MFKLALQLGMTVSELEHRVTFRELIEWLSYYELEPWGSVVDGMRTAVVASTTANAGLMVASPKQLRIRPYKPKDFYVGVPQEKPSEDIGDKFFKMVRAFTGKKV